MALFNPPAGPKKTQRRIPPRWLDIPYAGEAIGQDLQDLFSQPFELLLGRRTYEIFAAYWPRVPVDSDNCVIADLFNNAPKQVVTHVG